MATRKYKTGDMVQLISGGPFMTVADYYEDQFLQEESMLDCDWFDDKNNPHRKTFKEDQLTIVEKSIAAYPLVV
ncbi:MAG: DUF2158 domain-containing protein [Flavobacteriales bacterium]|nr:DUF2158 domain-containing protein [Flavobacteriales bacterium]